MTPVGGEKQDSAAHGDIRLGGKYSIRNVTVVRSDGCDLTHRLNHAEIDWCGISVDRLIWGYHVSCLVAIVNRDRTIGRCMLMEGSGIYASTRGLEDRPVIPCDVIPVFVWMTEKFKAILNKVMLVDKATVDSHGLQWGEDNTPVRGTRASVNNRPIRVAGRFGCLYSPVQGADWLDVLAVGGGPVRRDVRIGYIGDGFFLYQSSDAAPLTDLQDLNKLLHIYSDYTTGLYLIWTANITVRISLSVEEVTSCCGEVLLRQTMDGAASADDRPGVMFTAELCVPWDAPEAVVDVDSEELISLGSFPDKVGLFGRRKEAAVSRIMTGRDSRSVRFVVPDGRLIDRGHHDVTIVDMEEDREPMVVLSDMTRLRELWPVEVFDHMKRHQQDLEQLRKRAKKDYQQTRPMPCRFCGKVIRVDMYRHVARIHLDLVQLWRCPIAWCTTWKGSPQDCLEHVRSGHDAPWVSKTASIERYAPPPPPVDGPSPAMDRVITDRALGHINGYAPVQ